MTGRTKIVAQNIRDAALNVTDNYHAVTPTDVTNGIEIVNFFENVDNSGALLVGNSSANTDYKIYVQAGYGVRSGLGYAAHTIPYGKRKYILVDDSSRFGVACTDSDSKTHVGLDINFEPNSGNNLTLIAVCKQASTYTTPSVS